MAFSPDGKTLATTSKDNFVRLWDVADPHHPHLLFEQPSHDSTAALLVAFGPDGKTLATTSYDRIAWLWDLDPANLARRACTTPTNRITPDEWRHYLRNVPYRAPC
ncbi:WD40 repeat domain-containing protein [Frankia sp. QA3]|uniref:WD40 repeat domain-containing protein n=1 Tax=Frankia sp. QA3 TaxID=710111 RepID=UPI0002F144E7|nr:WD40 repeat domain-containing protein [Frankia sp. QA3]